MLELLQIVIDRLSASRWAWLVDASLLIILGVLTLLVVAGVIYSKAVQRLWVDVKNLIGVAYKKAGEASKSPYDKNIKDSVIASWLTVICFYLLAFFQFIYFVLFVCIGMGVLGAEITFWARLLAFLCGSVLIFFARLCKAYGDRVLYEWKHR